jgi:hypothetical protein
MIMFIQVLATVVISTVLASEAFSQSAGEIRGGSPYAAIEKAPATKLIVETEPPETWKRTPRNVVARVLS